MNPSQAASPRDPDDAAGVRGIALLGATGSIGASTLDVIARHPQRYRVAALSAHARVEPLADLCARFLPDLAVIADPARESDLRGALRARGISTRVASGAQGLIEAATLESATTVVAAIVGAAGLVSTVAAARAGKRLLVANKEAIVCAGNLLMDAVAAGGATLLPVDSEHNAIHQCLSGARRRADVRRLVLTASGGPFRERADLAGVTPAQAVLHPKWVMGRKISVDSATLMNKGLEVIEASRLFGFAPEEIDVVVHPQSVIHSMVEFVDGSVIAQLGTPDMRTPIAYALAWPARIDGGSPRLDLLHAGPLSFEPPDLARFPCLKLAYAALRAGPAACIAANAANEVAVAAFLAGRLPFTAIARVIEQTLAASAGAAPADIEAVLALDDAARRCASAQLAALAGA